MAKGPTFDTITAAFASASQLNANFAAITTSFTNTISRDGSTPNTMTADFDMNSNDILNVNDITVVDVIVGGTSIATIIGNLGSGTVTTFLALTDVPASYSGSGGEFLKVNSGATALEFVSGAEPSDGDKGDITVTASGVTWSIDAGVVDTAELTDNGVTLGKLEHGTTGDILYYGASGVPFRLAKGSNTEVLTLTAGLPVWSAASAAVTRDLYHAQDRQASGADGGTFNTGARRIRTLNTEVTDNIGGVADLTSDVITLPVGTYEVMITVPAMRVNAHQAYLYNIDDAADELVGTSEYSDSGDNFTTKSTIMGEFTIAGTKTFRIEHECETSQASTGFGRAGGFGVGERYTDVMIWKIS